MDNESPFFRLPAEIREKILRFSLTPDEDDFMIKDTAQYPQILFRTYASPLPAAMRTCKRMYMEMGPWALTEIIIRESMEGSSIRTGVRCHGNLRFERLRRVSMVVAAENSDFISPSWSPFLLGVLKYSPDVDSLDIEFHKNEFRKEVEAELSAADERRHTSEERERDSFILKYYAQPDWLEKLARQPSLRQISFEGNVPEIWLDRLRRESHGRIQVFSDGVRFREKEEETFRDYASDENEQDTQEGESVKMKTGSMCSTVQSRSTDLQNQGVSGFQAVQFQVSYVPASRYD